MKMQTRSHRPCYAFCVFTLQATHTFAYFLFILRCDNWFRRIPILFVSLNKRWNQCWHWSLERHKNIINYSRFLKIEIQRTYFKLPQIVSGSRVITRTLDRGIDEFTFTKKVRLIPGSRKMRQNIQILNHAYVVYRLISQSSLC